MSGFREKLNLWLLGLLSASIEGGAVSVKAFIGLAAAHAAGMQVPVLDLEQLYYVFLFGAAYHFWTYLAANSLLDLTRPALAQRSPVPPTLPAASGPAATEPSNNGGQEAAHGGTQPL